MPHGDRRAQAPAVIYNVLVVDDYAPWRQHVCAEVRKHPRWRVIGEAADGLEAVQMAAAVQPDLIVLDIGLPVMNGIEAARRILDDRPDSKILFVTEQHSTDIVEAALDAGGRGYLLKVDAGRDLLFAMEAVVNLGRFVSASLLEAVIDAPAPKHWHEASFHSQDASLLDEFTRFAEGVLAAGNTLIFAANEFRRNALQQRLQEGGLDIDRLVGDGRCLWFDAGRFVSDILVDGVIDEGRFRSIVVPLIARAESTSKGRVAAAGEICGGLWRDDDRDTAIRLEHLWDELGRELQFDIFCGYLADVPALDDDTYALFQSICREHSVVQVR
jgi:DNA-binding NarL/FixJ family response regulator